MAVLRVTQELLERYDATPASVNWRWESKVVDLVLRYGSRSDAEVLLPVFLAAPEARERLVPVLAQHGDSSTAQRLVAACVESGRLRDGVPTGVLHAVGYLGYEPAELMLWDHVEGPHYGATDACLGLSHLPCRRLRAEIAEALGRHFGASLFPEFLPVLAAKTGDPSWLRKLVEWGEKAASTDCNGGLILGIALHGDTARAEFARLLWNPWWEAYGGGTGADHWAYAGARVLGLGMPELYSDLVAQLNSEADAENKRHCLRTFVALLRKWDRRPWLGLRMAPDPVETWSALNELLFEWSTPDEDDSLTGRAHRVLDHDDRILTDLYQLEEILGIRAGHEMEIREVTSD